MGTGGGWKRLSHEIDGLCHLGSVFIGQCLLLSGFRRFPPFVDRIFCRWVSGLRHIIVDLPAGQFYRIAAGEEELGLFANAAGVLSFEAAAAGPHDVTLAALPDPVPGDANLDGLADVLDMAVLANRFGHTGADWLDADFDGDETVGVLDLAILANHFGRTAGATSVPEPAALSLLALAAAAMLRRRRR